MSISDHALLVGFLSLVSVIIPAVLCWQQSRLHELYGKEKPEEEGTWTSFYNAACITGLLFLCNNALYASIRVVGPDWLPYHFNGVVGEYVRYICWGIVFFYGGYSLKRHTGIELDIPRELLETGLLILAHALGYFCFVQTVFLPFFQK